MVSGRCYIIKAENAVKAADFKRSAMAEGVSAGSKMSLQVKRRGKLEHAEYIVLMCQLPDMG